MAYSDKVLDHYERPRNVGTFDTKDTQVGTGMVGAPACGDVMRLQIKVSDEGVIEDAKFKTYGCLGSNTPIATPNAYREIASLKAGDTIWAWNGTDIVATKIQEVIRKQVHWRKMVRIQFDQERAILCTNDHIWWAADNRPLLTEELTENIELLAMTERELRSLNNVGKRQWLKDANSIALKERNKSIDHSKLSQNQKGYQHGAEFRAKISKASKKMWQDDEYAMRCLMTIHAAADHRPTGLEREFINLFKNENIDARYVGNGSFWVNTPDGKKLNPDFKVNGQRKLIEVYTSDMPEFMQNRTTTGWMIDRKQDLAAAGFDVMFIDIKEINQCLTNVQRFIHNGIAINSIRRIADKRGLRGLEQDGDQIAVYDLRLEEGAHCFFVQRAMSHNCGSAIASSSLLTEWVKGKTLKQALEIKNLEIAEELALPPVKIHCSVLAEDAIKAAIKDYTAKQKPNPKAD